MTTEQLPDEHWNAFYTEHEQIWSGKPNAAMVDEVSGLTPGRALDLGCGEGADAIWLAQQGWTVTAVDISTVALSRAARHAKAAGVAERIDWQQHELGRTFPDGEFDLVSAQFLHSPVAVAGEREAILASAAAAVGPGGRLLVVGHAGWPSWVEEPPIDFRFPANSDVLDALAAGPGEWAVETDEVLTRELTGPAGEAGTREDSVLRLHRLA